jgi:hypothetical protein
MDKNCTRSRLIIGAMLAAVMVAIACCFVLVPKAHAAEPPWNKLVKVDATANAYDPGAGGSDYNQTLSVSMTFTNPIPASITPEVAQSYIQTYTTIAEHKLTDENYSRKVDNVVIKDKIITFKVGPVVPPTGTKPFTAVYSGKFKVVAKSEGSKDFAALMGNNDVETLVNTGLGLTVQHSADKKNATIAISDLPKCRAMNFALISDGNNYIFSKGTSADGKGLTIHSHKFFMQTAADYATALVAAANKADATSAGYNFKVVDGKVQVSKIDGSALSNIQAIVYNGTYLNFNELPVGEITEPPMCKH